MLFNSLQFAIFLPIVFIIYWAIPSKFRWTLLLVASYYFYMSWNVKYVVLILLTTCVSFYAAILLEKAASLRRKKAILTGALIICFGVLFVFKYLNFFFDTLTNTLCLLSIQLHPLTLKLLLPVGISFYTFQSLSYVIDVYRGDIKAERHLGVYATFVSFFPQLVAGPIERTKNLLPQIKAQHVFDYGKVIYGLKLMAWGFFKKLVIADNLAIHVDLVFNDVFNYHGLSLLAATVLFAFQIYCDFSGYSDIAIGTANLFGIDLMTNFKSPYFSASLKEFWSRWHISLSTWFRDYIYIPLGGNRKGKLRTSLNLLITFLLSGLWHGADWTFVVWGGAHGVLQIAEKGLPQEKLAGKRSWWRVLITFVLVCICWAFFRANTMQEAVYVLTHGFDGISRIGSYIMSAFRDMQVGKLQAVKILLSLLILSGVDYYQLHKDAIHATEALSPIKRWILYYALIGWILIAGNFGSNQFVYFQF